MYPNKQFETVSMFIESSTRLLFGGQAYGSKLARSEKVKVIVVGNTIHLVSLANTDVIVYAYSIVY